jgi:hypothetical protein
MIIIIIMIKLLLWLYLFLTVKKSCPSTTEKSLVY